MTSKRNKPTASGSDQPRRPGRSAEDLGRYKEIRERFQREKPSLEELVSSGEYSGAKNHALNVLRQFHDANPLVAGMSKEELRDHINLGPEVFASVLGKLEEEKQLEVAGKLVHLPGRGVLMKDEEAESKKIIE